MKRLAALALLGVAAVAAYLWLRAAPAPPCVLLVTFDTTRRDAIGPDTPGVEAFLRTATAFPGMRVAAPLTLPTHLTLFSGLLPANHGIHDNVTSPLPLDRGFPLLAEEFRDAGYATAAFTAYAVMAPRTGAIAGFEHFDGPVEGSAENDAAGHRPCEERLEKALAWLASADPERPWFLWVHFFDPHAPYLPYEGDGRRAGSVGATDPRELYRGEVRRMDAAFEKLVAAVPEEAIVVLATDHGEGLGEHDEPAHGPLCYGSVIDGFLAVRGPGMRPGAVSPGPRSQADVAPTLRRWCGLRPQKHDGALLDGPPHAHVVSESLYTWRVHGWGQCFSVTDGRYTLVESGKTVQFFDRASDAGETRPLDPAGYREYEALDRALTAFRSQTPGEMPVAALQDSGTPYGAARRPLATYLSRQENAPLDDPRERFPYWQILDGTLELILMGRMRGDTMMMSSTIATLESLTEQDPKNPAPWSYLMYAQGGMAKATGIAKWNRAAARSARESIARGYHVASVLTELFTQSLAGGDPADVRLALEIAFGERIVPDLACVAQFVDLSLVLAGQGDASARATARTYVERWRPHLGKPEEQRALDRLLLRLE